MLWLINGDNSHEIISCNIHKIDTTGNGKKDTWQVWIERPNGKTMKIGESKVEEEVTTIKEAIDYAIQHGHKTLNLNK